MFQNNFTYQRGKQSHFLRQHGTEPFMWSTILWNSRLLLYYIEAWRPSREEDLKGLILFKLAGHTCYFLIREEAGSDCWFINAMFILLEILLNLPQFGIGRLPWVVYLLMFLRLPLLFCSWSHLLHPSVATYICLMVLMASLLDSILYGVKSGSVEPQYILLGFILGCLIPVLFCSQSQSLTFSSDIIHLPDGSHGLLFISYKVKFGSVEPRYILLDLFLGS